jgi:predicted DNA binding CopG/RHH family protein
MSTHADVLRDEQINLKLTPDELERLRKLAAHHALSPQSMLRMLLKRAADEFETSQAVPKPRRK